MFYIFLFCVIIILAEGIYIIKVNQRTLEAKIMDQVNIETEKSRIATIKPVEVIISTTTSSIINNEKPKPENIPPKKMTPVKTNTIPTKPNTVVKAVLKDKLPPTTPKILSGTSLSDKQINIEWSKSTDNIGVLGYNVFLDGVKVGSTKIVKYAFMGLKPATLYSFSVSAFDESGNTSPISSVFTLRTLSFYTFQKKYIGSKEIVMNAFDLNGNPIYIADPSINPQFRYGTTTPATSTTPVILPTPTQNTIPVPTPIPNPTPNTTPTTTPTLPTLSTPDNTVVTPITHKTQIINIYSNGSFSPSSIIINSGDNINFVYVNPNNEILVTFSPTPPSSIKLDHEFTSKSYTFTTTGTWTFKTSNSNKGTITVN